MERGDDIRRFAMNGRVLTRGGVIGRDAGGDGGAPGVGLRPPARGWPLFSFGAAASARFVACRMALFLSGRQHFFFGAMSRSRLCNDVSQFEMFK